VFLRYIEVDSEIEKTIGVLKKRFGDFERALRGLSITADGVEVGEKLTGLHGILTGVPERTATD
jgi:circadian clock protein KaiC